MRAPVHATLHATAALASLLATATGCDQGFDPQSLLETVRIITVVAEPPEVASGATSTLTLTHFPLTGTTTEWALCTLTPGANGELVNEQCLTSETASYLTPLGEGDSISFTMPPETFTSLGLVDATGGLYVPLRVTLSGSLSGSDAGATGTTETDVGVYRLRWHPTGSPLPPNRNPSLEGVYVVPQDRSSPPDAGAAGTTPLDDAEPYPIHVGQTITLRALFEDGSAETYETPGGTPGNATLTPTTETLDVSWYASAGKFSVETTGPDSPDTDFTLGNDENLPPVGAFIDLFAVGQDERGGGTVEHRRLQYVP